jgi:hypothetical protein
MKSHSLPIQYCFTLNDGSREIFTFQLDTESFELLQDIPGALPSWTALSFHQCPHCPLIPETHPFCPVAVNIANIVMRFDRLVSHEEIQLDITTEERIISQKTPAQRGVSSLLGLVIANSGCPHTTFFRPMTRFHLPLASVEETIFRAASMYLLAQYFLREEGHHADLELRGLRVIYDNIHIVNRALVERLQAVSHSDLPANAVILLDLYAMAFPHAFEEVLQDIHQLLRPFLNEQEGRLD